MRMLIRHHWDGRFSRASRALGLSSTGRSLLTEAHEHRISCQFVDRIAQGGAFGEFDTQTHCCNILTSVPETALPLVLVDLISRGLEPSAPPSVGGEVHWAELLVAREMAEAGVSAPLGWYLRVPGDIGRQLRRASMVMLSDELVGREAADLARAETDDLRQVG